MNEAAIKLIKEAVLRALNKRPNDAEYFSELSVDETRPVGFRRGVKEALTEWRASGSVPTR